MGKGGLSLQLMNKMSNNKTECLKNPEHQARAFHRPWNKWRDKRILQSKENNLINIDIELIELNEVNSVVVL